MGKRVDVADVLSYNAHEHHLQRAKEEKPNHQRGDANGKVRPENQLIYKIGEAHQEREGRARESGKGDGPQGNLG